MKRLRSAAGLSALAAATVAAGVAAAGTLVPLKATDSGSATVIAAAGSVIETADTATGTGTQIGQYTMVAGEHINLESGAITDGYFTITAANGDTLTGTYSGRALDGLTGYDVAGPITGGTGRFADASGTIVFNGKVDPTALTFSDVVTGTISTVGSR